MDGVGDGCADRFDCWFFGVLGGFVWVVDQDDLDWWYFVEVDWCVLGVWVEGVGFLYCCGDVVGRVADLFFERV